MGEGFSDVYLRIVAYRIPKSSVRFRSFRYRLQRELQSKRQELQTKLMEDAAKLSAITAETREFKAFVEEQISPLVKGCKIHITGDINNTLMRS